MSDRDPADISEAQHLWYEMLCGLTHEQTEILKHTLRRAAAGRYCGDSKDMQGLVQLGLMRSLGKAGWCPDEFFALTTEGRHAAVELDRNQPTKGAPPCDADAS